MSSPLSGLRTFDIKWSHATNTCALIDAAFDDAVHFLEADIVCVDTVAVMGHDLHSISHISHQDLVAQRSFPVWLQYALQKMQVANRVLGLKLDFKDPNAVSQCIAELNRQASQLTAVPIWLNADVLQGPYGGPAKFLPASFIGDCASFQNAPLSIGWTTAQPPASAAEVGYSDAHIDEMIDVCQQGELMNRHITFPVRACLALASLPQLHRLLNQGTMFSLTVWHGAEGCTRAQRDRLVSEFGDRLYVDVKCSDE